MRMFYADTAFDGNSNLSVECGFSFFGPDHLLSGTDMPFDVENGGLSIRETIAGSEKMDIAEPVRQKIYEDNARQLLHIG
jgi:uncharacterized protein